MVRTLFFKARDDGEAIGIHQRRAFWQRGIL